MARVSEVVAFALRSGKRVAVTVVGLALLLGGLAGIVLPLLPGPLLIIGGLAVLATEYVWAKRALEVARRKATQARDGIRRRRNRGPGLPAGPDTPSPGGDGS
ncbi:MAG: PGPGW domain-containing protein [Acidimicrobiia bacterium]